MRIGHSDAVELENIVRKTSSCGRAGMGGYTDADHFEPAPFDAALVALAPSWERAGFHEVKDFLLKWEEPLRSGNGRNISIVSYISELENLVTIFMQR